MRFPQKTTDWKKSACCIKQNGWLFLGCVSCMNKQQRLEISRSVFQNQSDLGRKTCWWKLVGLVLSIPAVETRLLGHSVPPWRSSLIATFQCSAKLGSRVLQSYQLLPTLPEIEVSWGMLSGSAKILVVGGFKQVGEKPPARIWIHERNLYSWES